MGTLVQKPYLRNNHIESDIEEDNDRTNQFTFYILPDPISIGEDASKLYVDNTFKDPSIIKNNAHVDFSDEKLDDVRFIKVNSLPAVREHLSANYYFDQVSSKKVDE